MSLDLHILGTRTLLSDGAPTDSRILAQPKRLGVLSYLALARAEGREWVSRDELLALFWPDTEAAKARKALSQTLWMLANEIDEDLVAKRGKGDVGVTPLLDSDVERFLLAVEEERWENALDSYRGDLLAGFHVSGAPGFQHWLDQTRGRLRGRALEAGWKLARAAHAAGDEATARRWARRVLHLAEPMDEGTLRGVMTFLDESGDRAGALAVFEAHANALAEDGDAPLPDTTALADRIRGPERPAARPGRKARRKSAAGEPAPRGIPWEKVAWPVIIVVAVLGHALVTRMSPPEEPPVVTESSPGRLLILPFSHSGDDRTGYLQTAVVDLLALRLDGIAELRAVDPAAVFSALSRPEGAPAAPALQAEFGAELRLEGTVTGLGDSGFELNARLIDRADSVVGTARASAARDDDVLEAVDALALGLLGERLAGLGEPLASSAALDTRSVEALRTFLRGEAAFRRSDFPAAGELYEQAVQHDSTFALAFFRMSRVGDWTNRGNLMTQGIDGAERHRERLPPRVGRLLDGYLAFWRGSIEEGLEVLEGLVEDHPFDPEARFQLADARFHGWPRMGTPILESAADFRAALELNPGDRRAMLHLMGLAAYAGDVETSTRLGAEIGSGDAAWNFRRAALTGVRPPARPDAALLERLDDVPIGVLPGAVLSAADFREDTELLRIAGERARESGTTDAIRVEGARLEVLAATAAGRLDRAELAIERLSALDPASGRQARAYVDALPWTPLPAQVPDADEVLAGGTSAHDRTVELLSALLLVKDARPAEARRILTHTAAEHVPGNDWTAGAIVLVESAIIAEEGRPEEALERLAEFRRHPGALGGFGTSHFFPHVVERFHRARLLETLGRDEEALAWYGTVAAPVSHTLAWAAPAHLARARILERLGRDEEAAESWRRAAVLWENCSDELLAVADEARLRAGLPTSRGG